MTLTDNTCQNDHDQSDSSESHRSESSTLSYDSMSSQSDKDMAEKEKAIVSYVISTSLAIVSQDEDGEHLFKDIEYKTLEKDPLPEEHDHLLQSQVEQQTDQSEVNTKSYDIIDQSDVEPKSHNIQLESPIEAGVDQPKLYHVVNADSSPELSDIEYTSSESADSQVLQDHTQESEDEDLILSDDSEPRQSQRHVKSHGSEIMSISHEQSETSSESLVPDEVTKAKDVVCNVLVKALSVLHHEQEQCKVLSVLDHYETLDSVPKSDHSQPLSKSHAIPVSQSDLLSQDEDYENVPFFKKEIADGLKMLKKEAVTPENRITRDDEESDSSSDAYDDTLVNQKEAENLSREVSDKLKSEVIDNYESLALLQQAHRQLEEDNDEYEEPLKGSRKLTEATNSYDLKTRQVEEDEAEGSDVSSDYEEPTKSYRKPAESTLPPERDSLPTTEEHDKSDSDVSSDYEEPIHSSEYEEPIKVTAILKIMQELEYDSENVGYKDSIKIIKGETEKCESPTLPEENDYLELLDDTGKDIEVAKYHDQFSDDDVPITKLRMTHKILPQEAEESDKQEENDYLEVLADDNDENEYLEVLADDNDENEYLQGLADDNEENEYLEVLADDNDENEYLEVLADDNEENEYLQVLADDNEENEYLEVLADDENEYLEVLADDNEENEYLEVLADDNEENEYLEVLADDKDENEYLEVLADDNEENECLEVLADDKDENEYLEVLGEDEDGSSDASSNYEKPVMRVKPEDPLHVTTVKAEEPIHEVRLEGEYDDYMKSVSRMASSISGEEDRDSGSDYEHPEVPPRDMRKDDNYSHQHLQRIDSDDVYDELEFWVKRKQSENMYENTECVKLVEKDDDGLGEEQEHYVDENEGDEVFEKLNLQRMTPDVENRSRQEVRSQSSDEEYFDMKNKKVILQPMTLGVESRSGQEVKSQSSDEEYFDIKNTKVILQPMTLGVESRSGQEVKSQISDEEYIEMKDDRPECDMTQTSSSVKTHQNVAPSGVNDKEMSPRRRSTESDTSSDTDDGYLTPIATLPEKHNKLIHEELFEKLEANYVEKVVPLPSQVDVMSVRDDLDPKGITSDLHLSPKLTHLHDDALHECELRTQAEMVVSTVVTDAILTMVAKKVGIHSYHILKSYTIDSNVYNI